MHRKGLIEDSHAAAQRRNEQNCVFVASLRRCVKLLLEVTK